MYKDYWKKFCRAALIRATKTFCQALIGAIGTTATFGGVDWKLSFSMAAMSTLLSVLTSVAAGLPEVKTPELPKED